MSSSMVTSSAAGGNFAWDDIDVEMRHEIRANYNTLAGRSQLYPL